MFKLSPVVLPLLVLLVGRHILCSPIKPNVFDEEEIVEVDLNNLDDANMQPSKDIIDLSFYGMAMYGEPDEMNTAKLVANYTAEATDINPEELGSYLEGDILIPQEKGIIMKNGLTTRTSRWPKGIVPFEIRGNFNARDMSIIENAIEEYHRRTCVRFVRRTSQRDYIAIVSGNSGCWSSVGRIGGKQEVNLQSPGCLTKPGTAIHELMHALGFLHEQNREERDSFVSIQYANIQPSAISNFDRASRTIAFGVPYDYGSVMHYSANAFSTNGRATIVPVRPIGASRMGQRDGFSPMDIDKLNQMYDCGYGGSVAAGGAPGVDNTLVNNFVSGVLTGLGYGDDASA